MQSDNLIKKLLRSAAICEAVYFGISFAAMTLSGVLLKIFGNYGSSTVGSGESFAAFLPEIGRLVLLTAAFFAVWHMFDKAVDPQKYNSSNGLFLVALVVFGTIASYAVNILFNVTLSRRFGLEVYAQLVSLRSFLAIVGYLNSAAIVLLWIALGMEWYRDKLIKEQAEIAQKAAEENAAQQSGTTADASADSGWNSYRSTLIKEQAEAEPPQEFIFNDKQ